MKKNLVSKLSQRDSNKILTIVLVIFGVALTIIGFLPYFFTKWSILDFTKTGQIGDTIGGIMSPFIGIIGALLTFAAFWVQYTANQKQFDILNKQQENIVKDGVEKPLYFLLEHYSKLENQLNHGGRNGKSVYGLFLLEIKFVVEEFYKVICTSFNLSKELNELSPSEKYSIIKISVDWWWDGLNKQKSEKEILLEIVGLYKSMTNVVLPDDLDNKIEFLLYDGFNNFIERCRSNTYFSIGSVMYINPGEPRSHLLSAYYKAIYNILFYINDSDVEIHNLDEKKKWVKFFIELFSDEELELLAYVALSKVLYGLEIKPKERESHIKDKNEILHNEYWVNRILISKYGIFDNLYKTINIRQLFEDIYINHTYGSKMEQLEFEYTFYNQIWVKNS